MCEDLKLSPSLAAYYYLKRNRLKASSSISIYLWSYLTKRWRINIVIPIDFLIPFPFLHLFPRNITAPFTPLFRNNRINRAINVLETKMNGWVKREKGMNCSSSDCLTLRPRSVSLHSISLSLLHHSCQRLEYLVVGSISTRTIMMANGNDANSKRR